MPMRAPPKPAPCASKKAKDAMIVTEAARSCLLGEPMPDVITMYPQTKSHAGADLPAAAPLRKVLLKNPKDVPSLLKLAEMHLGAGDLGVALLLLERAESVAPKRAEIYNLRGVTLQRLAEPQEAADAFEKAVSLDGSDRGARFNLAAATTLSMVTWTRPGPSWPRREDCPPPLGDRQTIPNWDGCSSSDWHPHTV